MLQITIKDREFLDEKSMEFFTIKGAKLSLEHSLISISKWESNWEKPFFREEPMTVEETVNYIKCMTLTQNVNPQVYSLITPDIMKLVNDYMSKKMTATTFNDSYLQGNRTKKKVITSEEIYYWMIALNIPVEFEKWHINRLMTLIRICEIKSHPSKKMNRADQYNSWDKLNQARKAKLKTSG